MNLKVRRRPTLYYHHVSLVTFHSSRFTHHVSLVTVFVPFRKFPALCIILGLEPRVCASPS